MARWDIYNIIGDATPILDYEFECRDWDWKQQVNPTSDVGLAFHTIVRALSEEEKQWTDELFKLIGECGGGRIIRYEGSSVDGSVGGSDLHIDEGGNVVRDQQWYGKVISVDRVDERTIYDRAEHDGDNIDYDLTIKTIPYSMQENHARDPDPRFHLPLLKVVEQDTGLKTVYKGHWDNGWRTAGELPDCVYSLKEIPNMSKHGWMSGSDSNI